MVVKSLKALAPKGDSITESWNSVLAKAGSLQSILPPPNDMFLLSIMRPGAAPSCSEDVCTSFVLLELNTSSQDVLDSGGGPARSLRRHTGITFGRVSAYLFRKDRVQCRRLSTPVGGKNKVM